MRIGGEKTKAPEPNTDTVTVINESTEKPIEVMPITTVRHLDSTSYEVKPTLSHVNAVNDAAEQRSQGNSS